LTSAITERPLIPSVHMYLYFCVLH
jgi:hypothetical protein